MLYPFILQMVSPAVTRVWGNVPVLESPFDVCTQPCESVVNRPLPCVSYQSFKIYEISAYDFGTMSMRRRFHACVYEFLSMVIESVVHYAHKVVIRCNMAT